MDAIKILVYNEWQRLATALSLHSGLPHLFSNAAFGAFFLALLARMVGIGRAFLLTVLGGIAGNAISLFLHDITYQSIGFSTALFASIGVMAAIQINRATSPKKMLMPLASAFALLAMLGTEGAHTDYPAHISGLLAGIGIGFFESVRIRHHWPGLSQFWSGLLGCALLVLPWIATFYFAYPRKI